MTHVRTWTIDINITEQAEEGLTRATAVLHSDTRTPLHGEGEALRRPTVTDVPQIGDELATARAVADLAYQLLDVTSRDIEQVTHRAEHLQG